MNKIILYFFTVTVILSACSSQKKLSKRIQGDWVCCTYQVFTFHKNQGSYAPRLNFTPFKINSDTITFQRKTLEYVGTKEELNFKILELNKKNLQLFDLQNSDTLILQNIKSILQKEVLPFNKIQFSSNSCYGRCPFFKMDIDLTNGKLEYEGKYAVDFIGKKDTALNIGQLERLKYYLKYSNLFGHSIQKDLPADIYTQGIVLFQDKNVVHEIHGESFKPEMKALMMYLMNLRFELGLDNLSKADQNN
jgi:hypothetical protein